MADTMPEHIDFDYDVTKLNFAFGLTPNNYDYSNMPDASEYFNFKVTELESTLEEDGSFNVSDSELPLHKCNVTDLQWFTLDED